MLTFLKLGGSLITDKTKPYTPRRERLDDISQQIANACHADPKLQVLLGHGSGSFGHTAAAAFHTRQGVRTRQEWLGFAEVWYRASELDRLVVESLHRAGLPVLTFPPSASVTAHAGQPFIWDIFPIQNALSNGLIPITHGDVAVDDELGGTILSTEDLFYYLAPPLAPNRILLAGQEEGVWEDFPTRDRLLKEITPNSTWEKRTGAGSSDGADVTGGMKTKITRMLELVTKMENLDVFIFSGCGENTIKNALLGDCPGTHIHC